MSSECAPKHRTLKAPGNLCPKRRLNMNAPSDLEESHLRNADYTLCGHSCDDTISRSIGDSAGRPGSASDCGPGPALKSMRPGVSLPIGRTVRNGTYSPNGTR